MKSNKVFKATVWYTVCNFLLNGISFLTTPIFSRILSVEEYGAYSNFCTWLSVITIVGTLSISSTLISARFDFKDNLKEYIASNLLFGSVVTIFVGGVLFGVYSFFPNFFALELKYVVIICVIIFFSPARDMFMATQRFEYKYKMVVALTVLTSILNVVLSLALLYSWEDNLLARVIGGQFPTFVLSVIIYFYFLSHTKGLSVSYCRYAIPICIPYIIHMLSGTILNSSDKLMISNICGTESNGYYSMAYNVAMIANILWSSMNNAFAPWLGEKLAVKDYKSIRKNTYIYVSIYVIIAIGFMLIAPEAILILGGVNYMPAQYVVPPVIVGYIFVFLYSLYVNIEQFEKKTSYMGIATSLAAAFNVITNAIFLPRFGYLAAAYTTLAGYVLLFICHFKLVKKMRLDIVYNTKFIFQIAILSGFIGTIVLVSYQYGGLRLILIILYLIILLYSAIKFRTIIKTFVK